MQNTRKGGDIDSDYGNNNMRTRQNRHYPFPKRIELPQKCNYSK